MTTLLIMLAVAVAPVIALYLILTAPTGYEDKDGFHYGEQDEE